MSNSWWANKLGGQAPAPQQQSPSYPAQAPAYPPQQSYPPQGYQQPVQPDLEGRRLPASAASADRCPNCSSGNYGKMQGSPDSRARCYDCGYPIQQSGSGVPGVRVPTEGPVQAAKQINSGGWNPGTIVDRIG